MKILQKFTCKKMSHLQDDSLAERFRRDNPEQFFILVRMHLSFVLDLQCEEEYFVDKSKSKKWSLLVPFGKKGKQAKGAQEGAPLTQEGICQVYQLIEFLKKEQNCTIEGIFRRTGSLERQQELRNCLSQGVTVDLESGSFSVHDCACVLKGFLAELPEPLLTEVHYPAYCQIAELCGDIGSPTQQSKLLEALQLILLLLPSENKVLLKDILSLLNLVTFHESSNKMSAENLAKLFTPHLLCPRKLSPENLLQQSTSLFGIVAFMIRQTHELFRIPPKLLVDFRARYDKSVLSPNNGSNLNVSTTDGAANTVFTFVDHERTAKENEANPTETALAQLYAHIQSLPESSKKRKLVKQFNRENGHGTPLHVIRTTTHKSFGDSIKKHIFHKNLSKKKSLDLVEQTTPKSSTRSALFCSQTSSSPEETCIKKAKMSEAGPSYTTSTPGMLRTCSDFTPEEPDRRSMSPITRSTQRMPRAMQETMMTPRSRKPVLLLSGTNITALPKKLEPSSDMDEVPEESAVTPECQAYRKVKSDSEILKRHRTKSEDKSLSEDFREYLSSRDVLAVSDSPEDLSFSSRTDDFNSTDRLSESLLFCLDGNNPLEEPQEEEEKELVLKPKQFDQNGKAIVFETSF